MSNLTTLELTQFKKWLEEQGRNIGTLGGGSLLNGDLARIVRLVDEVEAGRRVSQVLGELING